MAVFVWMIAALGVAIATLGLAMDALVRCVVHWFGPLLPTDLCGPCSWLVDTKQYNGIFDRSARG